MKNLILVLACLFFVIPCLARIITVDDDGPADFNNIQAAINDATNDTDTVVVADGIYTGLGNRDIDFLGKAITVCSENGPQNCIIDCRATLSNQHRGFYFHRGEKQYSVLDGFTIKNGYTTGRGGGIYCSGSSPTIINCIIKNNTSGDKYVYWSGGGGIYCCNSNAKFINCVVSDNYTRNWGGGIWCYDGGTVKLLNCVFTGNKADYVSDMGTWSYGGGISCFMANAEIKNCLIANNWAHDFTGGVHFNRSTSTVSNCTIVNNQADERTGGVYQYLSNVTIENSIIWGNTDPSSEQLRGTFTVSYSNIQGGWPGEGNIKLDPYFASDYHLKSQAGRWDSNSQTWVTDANTSPCIDAGDHNSDWIAELWPHGKRINMGAFGGTPQASMSLSDVGNIADLDNDDFVGYSDLMLYTEKWLNKQVLLSEDLNRNGFIDFVDFAIFASNWGWQ